MHYVARKRFLYHGAQLEPGDVIDGPVKGSLIGTKVAIIDHLADVPSKLKGVAAKRFLGDAGEEHETVAEVGKDLAHDSRITTREIEVATTPPSATSPEPIPSVEPRKGIFGGKKKGGKR